MILSVTPILLVFYLFLLVRWKHVRRPTLYLLGAAGLLLALFGGFFAVSSRTIIVSQIFGTMGGMIAFVCGIGTCYAAKLPVNLPAGLDETTGEPAATDEGPDPERER